MSTIEKHRSGAMATLDTALVAAGVIGGILVVLWLVHAVVGVLLLGFEVVVLIVAVALVVRLVHAFTRHR